ncbi:MAG: hybrid sensor histidine kinase/response regulator [Limisphaerales bacterium]
MTLSIKAFVFLCIVYSALLGLVVDSLNRSNGITVRRQFREYATAEKRNNELGHLDTSLRSFFTLADLYIASRQFQLEDVFLNSFNVVERDFIAFKEAGLESTFEPQVREFVGNLGLMSDFCQLVTGASGQDALFQEGLIDRFDALSMALLGDFLELKRVVQEKVDEEGRSVASAEERGRGLFKVSLVVLAASLGLVLWVLHRFIIHPIRQLARQAEASLKEGVQYAGYARGPSEIRSLSRSLTLMTGSLEVQIRKRTAELQSTLLALDSMDDLVFIFAESELKFRYANTGAKDKLGYTEDEFRQLSLVGISPDLSQDRMPQLLKGADGEVPEARQLNIQVQRKDGVQLAVELVIQSVPGEGNERLFIAVGRDVTERLSRELVERRAQRLESIGNLAGGLAHDLNNTLTPMMLGVEILRAEVPQQGEILEQMMAGLQRATEMLRQLLTFAKGDKEAVRGTVRVDQLLEETLRFIGHSFPKSIKTNFRNPTAQPVQVIGNRTQLYQVILNLCVNARDAMPDGGVLDIELGLVELQSNADQSNPALGKLAEGTYARLSFQDAGTGIPPEVLERIFEPFFTTKGAQKGTGLGLSTVIGIVKAHKGAVTVDSQVGQGTRFEVFLPLEQGVAIPSDRGEVREPSAPASDTPRQVLIIEDDLMLREGLVALLEQDGYRTVQASDGKEGLKLALGLRDSLGAVLVDIHMPHMNGEEFVRVFRQICPTMPILAMSAFFDREIRASLDARNVDACLEKPFRNEKFLATVKQIFIAPDDDRRLRTRFNGSSAGPA